MSHHDRDLHEGLDPAINALEPARRPGAGPGGQQSRSNGDWFNS